MIPYGRQAISEEDIQAVTAVLRSDWITQGPAIPRFEQAVATYCHVPYSVAVSSATAALHLACLALEVGPGDRVWTTPNTFVASANCALYCNATVDFVDIDPATANMGVPALARKLQDAEARGGLPKVVIPVHFSGEPCDMVEIAKLAHRYGFRIIEDASHAIGARYSDGVVGDCRHSDMTVFSFHPVKIITTGEGGGLTTQRPELARKLTLLRTHGITRDTTEMTGGTHGPWYYEQVMLGFNYRMTDLQAALGISQLSRIEEFVSRRHLLASRYDAALPGLPVRLLSRSTASRSALHLYVVYVSADRRRQVFDQLRERDVGVNVHYIPVHLQPYYRRFGFREGDFPAAERHYQEAISLPLYPGLKESEQDRIITALREVLQ
ncbi:MAG: UDP-4-amino-4,6-dideoxy-N-acetyl-beta-L-altrosamine transaminase [Nitrospira sp. CR1.1]|nr:UDP-4-amino-4,6-dideoxy-N-acetyl-beta-L-altrosamine transaminase [Nitrospira sp. CR1.1]